MKPPLINPSSMFFLLVIPFLISVNTPTSLGEDDSQYTNCSSTFFSCGNFQSVIGYPFWGGVRANYCGLPDFQLTCQSNIPMITIRSLKYRLLHLDSTTQTLVVARDDYFDTICPADYKKNTFDQTPFKYVDGGLVNVTFLYDYPTSSFLPSNYTGKTNCKRVDGTETTVNYFFGPLYSNFSCKSVVMTIYEENLALASANLQDALQLGFGLQWMVSSLDECNTCSQSGGQCGYDNGQFSCFCKDGPQKISCSGSTEKLGSLHRLAIAISVGVGGLALISILIIYICKKLIRTGNWKILKKTRAYHDYSLQSLMKKYGSLAPRNYSYSKVKRITKSFSNKLGEGGYGVVYKGSLPDGRLVAVKVIRESKGSGEEFLNEVASISRTSHVNIVTLLGFCYERNKRVLIYEYMSNGSLDNFIYKRGSPNAFCAMEWKKLYQIVISIAHGLEYLHRGCNTRILHLDIKPQNILLDEEFCPKISDFGLAKICQKKESIVSILGTRGTIGFIAPEVFNRAFGGVSHKADVYSYGMLVLEMVGGRKNYDSGGSLTDEQYFPDWIYRDLEQGKHPASSIVITTEDDEMVRKMTLVSLWCVQTNPLDRPAMSKVLEMLEGPLQSLSVPPKPTLEYPTESPAILLSNGSSKEMTLTNSIST